MYLKYIILCLCVGLFGVNCDLGKEEGADCEWEGLKGKCVPQTKCLTSLERGVPLVERLLCSKQGDVSIICCTDCKLVNDTRNVVFSPTGGILWKDGTPARDNCLQYLDKLHYRCRDGGFYGGLKRHLDQENQCHMFSLWAVGGAPPPGHKPGAKYPHQALLGYGETLEAAKWVAGGAIISDRYILTSGGAVTKPEYGEVKFVAMDVRNRSDSSTWHTIKVKRVIRHPEYKQSSKYNDIALVETETPITFNINVLPACLHVIESEDDEAIATTWNDLNEDTPSILDNTIQMAMVHSEKFSNEECKAAYEDSEIKGLEQGLDFKTQMCYGSKNNTTQACQVTVGEPLMIDTQFSRCIYAIIGVTSFGKDCSSRASAPVVYTRVKHYVPWIESIVWP